MLSDFNGLNLKSGLTNPPCGTKYFLCLTKKPTLGFNFSTPINASDILLESSEYVVHPEISSKMPADSLLNSEAPAQQA